MGKIKIGDLAEKSDLEKMLDMSGDVYVKPSLSNGADVTDDPGDPDTGNGQDTPPADGLSQDQLDSVLDYVAERSRKGMGFMLGKLWVSTETLLLALHLLVAVIGIIVISSKKR